MAEQQEGRFSTSLRKGDKVVVVSGKDKGKVGGILQVLTDRHAVLVEKVNMIKRHTKPSRTGQGGIVEKEAPIHISKVMVVDPGTGRGARVGNKVLEDGRKVRVTRGRNASGEVLDR
ncbi:MAG: 50S ribosomal protein L24 [Magnetococcus sp. WYHC-3]